MKSYRKKKIIQRLLVFPQLKAPFNITKHLEMKKAIVNQKTSSLHYLMMKCNRSKNELVEWMYEFKKEKKSEIVLSSKQIEEIRYRNDNKKQRSKSMINKKKDMNKSVNDYSELEKLQIRLKDSDYLNECRLKLKRDCNNNNNNRCNESCDEGNDTICNIQRGKYHYSIGKPIYIRINPFNKEI